MPLNIVTIVPLKSLYGNSNIWVLLVLVFIDCNSFIGCNSLLGCETKLESCAKHQKIKNKKE